MTKRMILIGTLALGCFMISVSPAQAKDDNFDGVVKVIERFYRVKHKGIPFLARAGMKTAVTAARIAGGSKKRLAEAGSVKVAYFEDQDFESGPGAARFREAINTALGKTWNPFVQVTSPKSGEQVYIFLRHAGDKFHVMTITIDRRDASVVQVTLSPSTLAKLLQDPEDMGRAINDEATTDQ
ncbi:MAG TPA: hypothetical protein VNO50_20005 [Pyrinomonadaceae bacterium]|nr:hypothetical protein [Pyrinomonadaceae bacterium]